MNFSKNFKEEEFLVSLQYPYIADKMRLRTFQRQRLILLCNSILQPLRDKFGKITIVSGKRTKTLNSLVGGSEDSDHIHCIASDIYPEESRVLDVYNYIKENLPYRELILHFNSIHVSVNIYNRKWKKYCEKYNA